jgi:formate hydrogenlyase subunit 3/multisubunit Na+/H+ antiporter MnhD subunit
VSALALLLVLAVAVPLVLSALVASGRGGDAPLRWLGPAPWPGLLAALAVPSGASIHVPLLDLTLALDRPGAILMGGAACLWSAAGFYAAGFMAGGTRTTGFAAWWLLTLAGSLGVFLAADLTGFYLLFAVVSLAAWGLVAHEGTPASSRAAGIYVALALLGEVALLLAFVMLAAGRGNPLIADAVQGLAQLPSRSAILALLVLGFGLKMGLLPVHVWLPIAHPAAPTPASAVLSGVVVKAGVIGLIRFLPFSAGDAAWGDALQAVGLATAFAGVLLGLTQGKPKTILAYSTVSQMGLVAFALGAGLSSAGLAATEAAAGYALHHMLAKGALFMAVGLAPLIGPSGRRPFLLGVGFLALGMAGLPLTGGSIAKAVLKPLSGSPLVSVLLALSSAGSAALMLHFTLRLGTQAGSAPRRPVPGDLLGPWLCVALLSVLGPWLVMGGGGLAPWSSLAPLKFLDALLPILAGAAALWGVARSGWRPPRVPEGDVASVVEPLVVRAAKLFSTLASGFERVTTRWPVAGALMLVGAAALLAIIAI